MSVLNEARPLEALGSPDLALPPPPPAAPTVSQGFEIGGLGHMASQARFISRQSVCAALRWRRSRGEKEETSWLQIMNHAMLELEETWESVPIL